MRRQTLPGALLVLVLSATQALPCTNFCDRADGLFGRNYDFEIGFGAVVINKRGANKVSLSPNHPAAWTARYASITFNQFGRDVPMDGMNERGLVIALAWLDETRYPAPDERPEVNELEWIQYQLDTAGSVEEVIAQASQVRIASVGTPLHYLVADGDGNTAAIEFLDGNLVVHTDLAAPALSNDSYTSSLAYLDRLRSQHSSPKTDSSLDRFARAALMLSDPPAGSDPIAGAFDILAAIAESNTRWSIVYDQRALAVYYRTADNPSIRMVRLSSFDPGCSSATVILDVNEGSDDVTASFVPYTYEANLNLARMSFKGTSTFVGIPDEFIEMVARHPDTSTCTLSAPRPRRRAVRR